MKVGISPIPRFATVADIALDRVAGLRPPAVAVARGRLAATGIDGEAAGMPVGYGNAVTASELGIYAARSYSLIKPPRTARRLIRSRVRSQRRGL